MMIDPHVLKARAAAEQYKALNTNTIEKVSAYDPKTRCWTFKKVQIDPRAKEFKHPEGAKINPPKKKVKTVNDTPKPKKQSTPRPKGNTKQIEALELAKSGKHVTEIAEILNVNLFSVYRYLKAEGFKPPKKKRTPNERYKTIKAMLEKGMKPHEIKKATGMKTVVHYYINEIKKNEK